MILYIKYMVSLCCKKMVKTELDKLDISHGIVELGEVDIKEAITDEQRAQLSKVLAKSGFELMDDPKSILIEKIKNLIIDSIHYSEEPITVNYSVYLSENLDKDYTYMANIFSEAKGITIENFIIAHKVEKVKELLLYNELSITEISYKLNYSSVAHLSSQFKKVTGLTPTYFKSMKKKKRIAIEQVGIV
ncbi:MAG: helix-turn-helix domain-containing protein [Bacteroidia bacterium]